MGSANRRCQTEIERLQVVLRVQGARIREFEDSVLEEQERTNAFREQAQAANSRLVRVIGDVRDRTDRILTECRVLVEDVAQGLAKEGQGHTAPSNPEEDPGEDSEEEFPPDSP